MATRTVTVTVCRGCCCGNGRKHPDVDHEGDLAALTAAVQASGSGVLRVVNCLDECERSNVVLVRRQQPDGPQFIWLGPLNDPADIIALAGWLRLGAPGDLPDRLAALTFGKRPARPPIAIRFARGEEDSLACPASTPAHTDDHPADATTDL